MSRVKIFMFAMYVWAFILYNLTRLSGWCLMTFMRMVPDSCSPRGLPLIKPPVNVVEAGVKLRDGSTAKVTNRLSMFIGSKWKSVNNSPSIDLDRLADAMGWVMLWICYTKEIDLEDTEDAERAFVKAIDFVEKISQRYEANEYTTHQSTFGRYDL